MTPTDLLGSNVSSAYGWYHCQAPQTIGNHSALDDGDVSDLEDTGPIEGRIMGWKWAFQIHMAAAVTIQQTVYRDEWIHFKQGNVPHTKSIKALLSQITH